MRPLSLDIAGLHSFRERRAIDFEPLLRDRLFGIFGPTGSGKSSILDAMTLALFGKIERTKGGEIASAINAREKECVVAFTFAIGTGQEERRYQVERLYRALKSGMKSEARLIDLTPDPPVTLADKTSAVSETIEEILGIKAHDFRLSVVLPQGAFAEFLHLRPKDRGEMLQRIFGLEEMGNRINHRLRELRVKLESERTGIEARLEGLKEYDDDALARRRKELDDAIVEAERSKAGVSEIERRKNEAEELYTSIVERDRLLENEAERKDQRGRLVELRHRLERAEKAAAVESVVRRSEEARRRYQEAVDAYAKANEVRRRAEEAIDPLRVQKEKADRERSEAGRLTELERGIRVLEALVEIDERIGTFTRLLSERQDRISRSKALLEENRTTVEQIRETEGNVEKALTDCRARIAAIDEGIVKLEREALTVVQLERLADRRREKETLLKRTMEEEEKTVRRLNELRKTIEKGKAGLQISSAEYTAARDRYEEARRGNALGEVLAALHDGEPCPLCGSIDHPNPHVHDTSHDLNALASNVRIAEQAHTATVDRLRELEKEETAIEARRFETGRRREEIGNELERVAAEIESVATEAQYEKAVDSEALSERRTKIAGSLARGREERALVEKKIEAMESTLRETRERVTSARETIAKLEQAIASDQSELERDTDGLDETRSKREERLKEIGIVLPEGQSTVELAARSEEWNRLKRELDEIERRFEEAQRSLTEASKEYDRSLVLREREESEKNDAERELKERLIANGFASSDEWGSLFLPPDERTRMKDDAERLDESLKEAERRLKELAERIGEKEITAEALDDLRTTYATALGERERALTAVGKAEQAAAECAVKNEEWKKIVAESERSGKEYAAMRKLAGYVQGNAFINFLADEGLQHICRTASHQLLELTGGRLAIGSRSEEGFYIRDNGNGGAERPPGSLSGGETFLVSLALSLALSDSLQVGRAPMDFFFLDEGFGTLDDDLLEIVLDSLERLRSTSHRAIGVISHVPQLRERISRRLIVTPSSESSGSDIRLEIA